MSQSLHAYIDALFRRTFGEPDTVHEHVQHWAIRPEGAAENALAINVLVNGSLEIPTVWVFDPYDDVRGTFRTSLPTTDAADHIIKDLLARLKRAGRRGLPGT